MLNIEGLAALLILALSSLRTELVNEHVTWRAWLLLHISNDVTAIWIFCSLLEKGHIGIS